LESGPSAKHSSAVAEILNSIVKDALLDEDASIRLAVLLSSSIIAKDDGRNILLYEVVYSLSAFLFYVNNFGTTF
jgi:hypothetical protein